MTLGTLIRQSLRFHARSHFGVVIGAAIGSAALIGALVVGDSVKGSLRERALERIGRAYYLLEGRDRTFGDSKGTWVGTSNGSGALGLHSMASVSAKEGAARANQVNLYGVESDFWRFSPEPTSVDIEPGKVLLNQALALQLGVSIGDVVLVRFRKPSAFSSEVPLSPKNDNSFSLRLEVQRILSANEFGDFSPQAGSAPALNAFVRLGELQKAEGLQGRANFVLRGRETEYVQAPHFEARTRLSVLLASLRLPRPRWLFPYRRVDVPAAQLTSGVKSSWSLTDTGLILTNLEQQGVVELKSSRVFLDRSVVREATTNQALLESFPRLPNWLRTASRLGEQRVILTYLANLIRSGTNTTPYSMVTAAGPPYAAPDTKDNEIILNQWLADDLQARQGEEVSLTYFDPESGGRLIERTNTFRVRAIVPMELPWADRALMPDFPGIEKAESTSDWDAGFPLVNKIRPKDEDYWRKFRGTPKAFITLAAGQKMWANRFGDSTAVRFAIPRQFLLNALELNDAVAPVVGSVFVQILQTELPWHLRPEELGLQFEAVRGHALKAAEQAQDFGQLFLGFSIFLVAAALLLMALLFQFGLEQRATEIGTLLALGFRARQVRLLLLGEAIVLALLGGILGAVGGVAYARAMLWGLATVWRSAVGPSALSFHASPGTLVIGTCASAIVAVLTIWLTLRKQAKQPARELLAGEVQPPGSAGAPRKRNRSQALWGGLASGLGAVAIIIWALLKRESEAAGAFFGAGALLLAAGLAFAASWLRVLAWRASAVQLTLAGLGVRGCARRGKRSLATVALLACGCFVVVAIGVFRLDANQNAAKRSSGTGGFALLGESTMPVVQDLNTKAGQEFFGLGAKDVAGVNFVPFRVRAGDEASCLNLNRAQTPRVLGVKPEALAGRFTFAKVEEERGWEPWELLHRRTGTTNEEIPAIGDANSIQWALGKKIGDTIDYTDEYGRAFKLRLVGAVANSILQGSLIIDEAEFVKRFPGESGYRMFVIDAPSNQVTQVSATLSRALQDVGLEVTPATQRLNAFNAVQNTYLGTFQILGGLGLLLGSAGLCVVVLRNILERRGELALLLAVGFTRRALQKLVLSEHGALLGLGLGIGIACAAVAVLPALLSQGRQLPYVSLGLTLGAVLVNGLLWTWVATRYALKGNLLGALRNE